MVHEKINFRGGLELIYNFQFYFSIVKNNNSNSNTKKIFYTLIGTISLLLGIIGIILPVLPTTPFILFSAWCYFRGSRRFHDWLINHPYLGPIVAEYGEGEGMTKESKIKAIIFTWTAVILTAVFILDSLFMQIIIVLIAIIGTIVLVRIKTKKK
jgi:hypothetical protein